MSEDQDSWGMRSGDRITAELTAMRHLGGGTAYEVFLAFDEITYAPVVVKTVRPAQVSDEDTLRGLRREVDLLRQVSHPAVVRALRSQTEGPRPHVVLEHLDGPRLSTLIRRYGPLEPAQYLPLGIEVASALHYLRTLEVVHLDVKPSNIIMGAPAKLIDLSVARPAAAAALLRHPIGTDDYMAPEQADPQRTGSPGFASDVWGLGASLFEAVAGYRAFADAEADAREPGRRYPQVADEPAELPPSVPGEVAALLYAALEKRPEDRPRPAELADAFGPILERHPRGRLAGFKVALAR
jgi:serine/threonine-protein kinase